MLKNNQRKIFLTRKGFERLKKELEQLTSVKRREVLERIAQARRSGNVVDDDSELNAALEKRSFIERRINELTDVLKKAKPVVQRAVGEKKTVTLGSTVVVEVDGERDEFVIVNSIEADPMKGLISNESIVGKALLGAKAGGEVKVTSAVETTYKILEIK
jgi:transcription elongation factor GreA